MGEAKARATCRQQTDKLLDELASNGFRFHDDVKKIVRRGKKREFHRKAVIVECNYCQMKWFILADDWDIDEVAYTAAVDHRKVCPT